MIPLKMSFGEFLFTIQNCGSHKFFIYLSSTSNYRAATGFPFKAFRNIDKWRLLNNFKSKAHAKTQSRKMNQKSSSCALARGDFSDVSNSEIDRIERAG